MTIFACRLEIFHSYICGIKLPTTVLASRDIQPGYIPKTRVLCLATDFVVEHGSYAVFMVAPPLAVFKPITEFSSVFPGVPLFLSTTC